MLFEWDEEKADANLKKHKVSFKVATTAFSDPFFNRVRGSGPFDRRESIYLDGRVCRR